MYRTRIIRNVYGWPRKVNIYREKKKVGRILVGREALVFVPRNKKYVTKIQYSNEFSLPETKYIHSQKVKDRVVRLIVWEGEKEIHKIKMLPFEGLYYAEPKRPLHRFLRKLGKKEGIKIPETVGVLVQKKVVGKHYNPTGPELFRISDKFKISDVFMDNLIKKKDTVYIVDFLTEEQYKEKVKEKLPEDYRMGFLRRLIKKR